MPEPAPVAAGTRTDWADVPEHVRGDTEAGHGSPVVTARTPRAPRDVPPEHLASTVACALGVFRERARKPDPPGLPTIRAWQAHCAAASETWLADGALWA